MTPGLSLRFVHDFVQLVTKHYQDPTNFFSALPRKPLDSNDSRFDFDVYFASPLLIIPKFRDITLLPSCSFVSCVS